MRTTIIIVLCACVFGWISFQARSNYCGDSESFDIVGQMCALENTNKSTAVFVPLPFVANRGQFSTSVAFYAVTTCGPVAVTYNGEIFYPPRGQKAVTKRDPRLREYFAGGTPARVAGGAGSPTRVNYFLGDDPTAWLRNVPTYRRVTLGEVYPGIAVELLAKENTVEKIFSLAPGADPAAIRVGFSGSHAVLTTLEGELSVATAGEEFRFSKPVAYQGHEGCVEYVDIAYRVIGEEYGFSVGA